MNHTNCSQSALNCPGLLNPESFIPHIEYKSITGISTDAKKYQLHLYFSIAVLIAIALCARFLLRSAPSASIRTELLHSFRATLEPLLLGTKYCLSPLSPHCLPISSFILPPVTSPSIIPFRAFLRTAKSSAVPVTITILLATLERSNERKTKRLVSHPCP